MGAVVVAVMGAALVTACSDAGASDSAASGGTTPVAGGTLTFAVATDSGCADPQQAGSADTAALRQVVDSLVDQDAKTGKIVPWLAESWTISADGKAFTFRLRPGVTFSDGTPLNAQVVKDNFDAVPKLGALAVQAESYLSGYVGTTVVDELTAKVEFAQPAVPFLRAASTSTLGLVSAATARKTPARRCRDGVIGTGPFVLSSYEQNKATTLTRRAEYAWGSPLWARPGAAYLDKIVFSVVPEAGVRTGSLVSGQLDVINGVGRADQAAIQDEVADLASYTSPGVGFNLGVNSARVPDKAVRQALLVAIDRPQVVSTVFPAGTRAATSVLTASTAGFEDLGSAMSHDPARARQLLDQAGWTSGPGGIRTKDGVPLRLTTVWFTNAAAYLPALELIQQQLKDVGVELVLKELQVSQFAQLLKSGDFDLFWGGNYRSSDPDALRTLYSTKLVNTYRIPVTELDEVLDQQAATVDEVQRAALVGRAQQLIVENAYVLPIVDNQIILGVAKDVHGPRFQAPGDISLHDTWKS
ncbi:ABC transporter substrate-binding protein [Frankia sp. CNm7]|uniref:ABC transporter substrate-binding protein n=2 Tax=Frankia nepalensis TaxID=1836974 RepID=A0A937UU69_9ACTN|nr:ABC transporter substrate-binding protein [Frankia nepalensis]MBL7509259.1 ABC transporter substrate-binding protein [Frankia nepalensis]MBL7522756.1 ABC transporter substrate-binding protein [Frankia nepalensis]MBL7630796.1 ABC transporter substrate-binding protein [Frankia nepalensis]